MGIRRELSLLVLTLGLVTVVNGQEISLDAATVGVVEGQTASVCVDITNSNLLDPTNPPTVQVSTAEDGGGVDFVPLDQVVTLRQEEPRTCFDILTIDDAVVEPIEIITVSLTNANGVAVGVSKVSISIVDNGDLVTVGFPSTALSGTEGERLSVCVEVESGSVQLPTLVNVDFSITDITTSVVGDYTIFETTINIPNGANVGNTYCQDILLLSDDIVEEAEETFSISLTTPGVVFVVVPDTILTVTIMDADVGRLRVTSPLTVTEGDPSLQVVISLSSDIFILERELVYAVQLLDGTATVGFDYQSLPLTEVTFSVGAFGVTRTVSVQIVDDDVGEADESFFMSLIPMSSDNDQGLNVALTILDNEPKCDSLEDPANGAVTVTGLYQGSTATYTCVPTHELVGESVRTCTSNGLWTPAEPTCALVECASLPNPANGVVTVTGLTPGSVATYICDDSYQLIGGDTRTCNSNGLWTNLEPFCIRVFLLCPTLAAPANGAVIHNGVLPGATATYTCDMFYELVGNDTRVCDSNGIWTNSAPTCAPVECVSLPDIANGIVMVTGLTPNSTASYTCNINYHLLGDDTRTCDSNGVWTNMEPTCAPDCPILPSPANGAVTQTGVLPGATATYTCDVFYELVGNDTRVCDSNGIWTNSAPTCAPVECVSLPDIANGIVMVTGLTPNSTASYTCNINYHLLGDDTRTCDSNGVWTNMEPTCAPDCPILPNPANGAVTQSGVLPGATATYTCDAAYQLVGSDERTCDSNAMWTDSEPVCALITCTDPPQLTNGQVLTDGPYVLGATVEYMCNSGYRFSSTDFTHTCQRNNAWTMEDIACEIEPQTASPLPTLIATSDNDGLSDGAYAGIIISVAVILLILVVVVVILGICLWFTYKGHSGKFKPPYDTQDQRSNVQADFY